MTKLSIDIKTQKLTSNNPINLSLSLKGFELSGKIESEFCSTVVEPFRVSCFSIDQIRVALLDYIEGISEIENASHFTAFLAVQTVYGNRHFEIEQLIPSGELILNCELCHNSSANTES